MLPLGYINAIPSILFVSPSMLGNLEGQVSTGTASQVDTVLRIRFFLRDYADTSVVFLVFEYDVSPKKEETFKMHRVDFCATHGRKIGSSQTRVMDFSVRQGNMRTPSHIFWFLLTHCSGLLSHRFDMACLVSCHNLVQGAFHGLCHAAAKSHSCH